MPIQLVKPEIEYLPAYVDALRRGWSPDNVRGKAAAEEELDEIDIDAGKFIASLDDREGKGRPILLPDGTTVPRLPGFKQWLWDGAFCGSIGLRWQPGTVDLPPTCLGHAGYAVVPWKRRQGYATQALALLLPQAAALGLPHIDLTTDLDNVASQKVIRANGGFLVTKFVKDGAYGHEESLLFRIFLADKSANI